MSVASLYLCYHSILGGGLMERGEGAGEEVHRPARFVRSFSCYKWHQELVYDSSTCMSRFGHNFLLNTNYFIGIHKDIKQNGVSFWNAASYLQNSELYNLSVALTALLNKSKINIFLYNQKRTRTVICAWRMAWQWSRTPRQVRLHALECQEVREFVIKVNRAVFRFPVTGCHFFSKVSDQFALFLEAH